jgi:hypothetical protein
MGRGGNISNMLGRTAYISHASRRSPQLAHNGHKPTHIPSITHPLSLPAAHHGSQRRLQRPPRLYPAGLQVCRHQQGRHRPKEHGRWRPNQVGRSAVPTLSTKEEQQLYSKQHLACAFRVFAALGFDEGVAGHMSLRDLSAQTTSG